MELREGSVDKKKEQKQPVIKVNDLSPERVEELLSEGVALRRWVEEKFEHLQSFDPRECDLIFKGA